MKLVFCGTPEFAVPSLEALCVAGHEVLLVVCQPDRPAGRGHNVSIPAVKRRALEMGLPVAQPEKIRSNAEFRERLKELKPEAIVVVAYGKIIPRWMLELPALGNLNVHASLLPKYRGAAPIQWAIASGEYATGVTTMRINEGLDTGPILLQREVAIESQDTAITLAPRLAAAGAELMVETLRKLQAKTLEAHAQNNAEATEAPILKKEDGRMDFSLPAQTLFNHLRGFQPWPGAFTSFRGKHLQILHASAEKPSSPLEASVLRVEGKRLFCGCGSGSALEILELQPAGKKPMSAEAFINGHRPAADEKLGA